MLVCGPYIERAQNFLSLVNIRGDIFISIVLLKTLFRNEVHLQQARSAQFQAKIAVDKQVFENMKNIRKGVVKKAKSL